MAKGLRRSLSRGPKDEQPVIRQKILLTNETIAVDGATGVGFGSLVIGDFPAGQIMFVGLRLALTITVDSEDVSDTFNGDIGIGTTPASDATITAADVDMLASTAVPAAVASVATVAAKSGSTESANVFNNDDGALEINLNLLIDDADIGADDVDFVLNGSVEVSYIVF